MLSNQSLDQLVIPLPPSLFAHHFFLFPARPWSKSCSDGKGRFVQVTQQFILTRLWKQLPTQPLLPRAPSAIIFKQSVLVRGSRLHVEDLRQPDYQ